MPLSILMPPVCASKRTDFPVSRAVSRIMRGEAAHQAVERDDPQPERALVDQADQPVDLRLDARDVALEPLEPLDVGQKLGCLEHGGDRPAAR